MKFTPIQNKNVLPRVTILPTKTKTTVRTPTDIWTYVLYRTHDGGRTSKFFNLESKTYFVPSFPFPSVRSTTAQSQIYSKSWLKKNYLLIFTMFLLHIYTKRYFIYYKFIINLQHVYCDFTCRFY